MKSLLSSLMKLHEWEISNLPFNDSIVGRHIYVCLARAALSRMASNNNVSIKSLLSTSCFTDRAIRLKLREMEIVDLILFDVGVDDRRIRVIRPTEKMMRIIEEHSNFAHHVISSDFMIIDKNGKNQ
jgi:hypothetical protein